MLGRRRPLRLVLPTSCRLRTTCSASSRGLKRWRGRRKRLRARRRTRMSPTLHDPRVRCRSLPWCDAVGITALHLFVRPFRRFSCCFQPRWHGFIMTFSRFVTKDSLYWNDRVIQNFNMLNPSIETGSKRPWLTNKSTPANRAILFRAHCPSLCTAFTSSIRSLSVLGLLKSPMSNVKVVAFFLMALLVVLAGTTSMNEIERFLPSGSGTVSGTPESCAGVAWL